MSINDVVFKEAYQKCNQPRPASPEDIKLLLEHDTAAGEAAINKQVDAFIDILRNTVSTSREPMACFVETVEWSPATCVRTLSSRTSHHISFTALSNMGRIFNEDISDLIWGANSNVPLILPQKHIAWINKISIALGRTKELFAQRLTESFSNSTENIATNILIAKRIKEFCSSAAITVKDIGIKKYPISNRTLRVSLQNTEAQESYRGKIQSLLCISLMADTSLDYFIQQDYSNYKGPFVSLKGEPVHIDASSRKILSCLLRCTDESLVDETIAYICAGKPQYP